jgi:hypothetical protein
MYRPLATAIRPIPRHGKPPPRERRMNDQSVPPGVLGAAARAALAAVGGLGATAVVPVDRERGCEDPRAETTKPTMPIATADRTREVHQRTIACAPG